MSFSLFIFFANLAIIIAIPIICYNEKIKEEEKKKQQAENLRRFNKEKCEKMKNPTRPRYTTSYSFTNKKYAMEQEHRARQREIEEHENRKDPTLPRYTPSYSFTNDSSSSYISSGFNYSNVRPNDNFLNKMGDPYLSNYEKQLLVKEDIQRMVDSYLPMNSIYRNSDGSVKQHDYSAFGIAANTPYIDLAEAQMFDNLDLF